MEKDIIWLSHGGPGSGRYPKGSGEHPRGELRKNMRKLKRAIRSYGRKNIKYKYAESLQTRTIFNDRSALSNKISKKISNKLYWPLEKKAIDLADKATDAKYKIDDIQKMIEKKYNVKISYISSLSPFSVGKKKHPILIK